ncbi:MULTISPECIES: hypothetical protein [Streptomyces]|uniref:hypothetical protein n=1 Tax=Streptomyces TaxID=1883 RepID=UPI00345BB7DF
MGASMLTATIAFPAASAELPDFDRGRQLLKKIEDPSLFTFDEPGTELEELLPDLNGESDLVDKDGEVLIEHARHAGLVIIDNLEAALDSRETTFLTVAGYRLCMSGGLLQWRQSHGRDRGDLGRPQAARERAPRHGLHPGLRAAALPRERQRGAHAPH